MKVAIQTITSGALTAALKRLDDIPWADHPLRKHLSNKRRHHNVAMIDLCIVAGWNYTWMTSWQSGRLMPKPHQLQDWIDALNRLIAEPVASYNRQITHRAEAA